MGMFGTPTNADFTATEALTLAIRDLHPAALRKWGMLITVTNDPTPANNITWMLVYNEASTDKSDNDNWVDAREIFGSDLSGILAGTSPGDILFNNAGSIGGFGDWDSLNMLINGGLVLDNYHEFTSRQSAAQPHRKLVIVGDWGGGTGPYGGSSGTVDRNVFLSDTVTDSIVTVLLLAQGVKSDGSMGISKLICASFRKDGVADPVQIGANTDLASKEDSPSTPTISIGLGAVGTDNIRISYDSNNVADIYTWTFSALLAFTKV